jgi:hypothetical protein
LQAAVAGVSPGETLVTDGFDKLQDGTKVTIRQGRSTANRSNAGADQEGETHQGKEQ